MADEGIGIEVPEDLKLLSENELRALHTQVTERFNSLQSQEVTPETLAAMSTLADHNDKLEAAISGREAEKRTAEEKARLANDEQLQRLSARVRGGSPGTGTPDDRPAVDSESIAAAAARGVVAALVAAGDGGELDVSALTERATSSLTAAQRHAPPVAPPPVRPVAVTAGVDIPGISTGSDLPTMEAMAEAFQKRARGVPVTAMGIASTQGGSPALSIRNEFEHTIDDRTPPQKVDELLRHVTRREAQDALVAGGGWCAPSETKYDFFNIADVDGLVDLPTVGISRGGIRFPVSPSLADVFINTPATGWGGFSATFGNQSVPWLWTETDDALTVTGTTNKPALRVPCPSFSEERLECYGVTLVAGNLADDAYPEATQNFLRLMMAAHAHAVNGRILALMVSKSSSAITTGDFATTTNPAFQQLLGGLSLASTDYRARYGMAKGAVLEAVIPFWVASAIQADLTWRTGTDQLLSVTIDQINSYFSDRGVRVQWVNDWQVRASGQFGHSTALGNWPATVDVMLYAAGTFVLGNGLRLDLGVVRDSVLNAENDFTAAWSEECHLVAKLGHESRLYRIAFNVNGGTNMTSPASAPYL